MKIRDAKRRRCARYREILAQEAERTKMEARAWLDAAPVGREFGSRDFERLAAADAFFTQRQVKKA